MIHEEKTVLKKSQESRNKNIVRDFIEAKKANVLAKNGDIVRGLMKRYALGESTVRLILKTEKAI